MPNAGNNFPPSFAARPRQDRSTRDEAEWRISAAIQKHDWRRRIIADPNVLVGKPVIKGTRISVELVMDLLAAGYSPDQICRQYDHLTLEDIHACLAYAREVIRSERTFAVKG